MIPDREGNLGIGATLRNKREEKGITLEQAQENTFIIKRYLEALEKERWDELPGKSYLIGYLKIYSRFLGLDPEPLIASLKEQEKPKKETQPEERKELGTSLGSKKIRTVRVFLFGCVIAAATLGIALLVYNSFSPTIPGQPANVGTYQTVNETAEKSGAKVEEEIASEENPPLPEPPMLSVTLLPEDLAWIKVESEGKTLFKGMLIPGKKYLLKSFSATIITGWEGNRVKIIDQFGNEGYLAENKGEFARSFTP